jgi:probable HAF family extracellular repeat protein
MKSSTLIRVVSTILFAALVFPFPSAAQSGSSAVVRYSVTNLGTLGGTSGSASFINNKGWIDGNSNLPGNQVQHAFLWVNGRMSDLGTLGGPNSFAAGMNNRGEVAVGVAETSTPDPLGEDCLGAGFGNNLTCLDFIWNDGVKSVLPTLGGNNAATEWGFNDRGQLVGFAETAIHDPTCVAPQVLGFEAVIWGPEKDEIHELRPLASDFDGAAFDINETGEVVGASGFCGSLSPATAIHAVLWQNGSVTDLGNLGGAYGNIAFGINNRRQIVGISDLLGDTLSHAFLWQEGHMTDLGTLPGDSLSSTNSINDNGQVVGQSCDVNFNCRAFICQDGVMADLNTLVPAGSSFYLLSANWINSRGQIVGQAFDQNTGEIFPFLATPAAGSADIDGPSAKQAKVNARITLPESVRKQLQQRHDFGRLGAYLVSPQ